MVISIRCAACRCEVAPARRVRMRRKKTILFSVILLGIFAALSGCGKSVPVENSTAVSQSTAEPVEETGVPDLTM